MLLCNPLLLLRCLPVELNKSFLLLVICPGTAPSRCDCKGPERWDQLIDNAMISTLIPIRCLHRAGQPVCPPVRCGSCTTLLPLWACVACHLCALVRMRHCGHFCWWQGSGSLPLAHRRCYAHSAATSRCAPLGARPRAGARPILEGLQPF